MNPAIDAARTKRAEKMEKLEAIVSKASEEERTLSLEEAEKFEKLSKDIDEIDARIEASVKAEERMVKAAAASAEVEVEERSADIGGVVVKRERRTYEEGDYGVAFGGASYLADMAYLASSHLDSNAAAQAPAARERMMRHAREVEVEARTNKDVRLALENVQRDMKGRRSGAVTEYEQRVNPNTTAGTGGEFVPPLWLVSQYVPFARPGRVFADRVTNMALPPGIDVINIPKITVGSLTAIQTANAAPVTSRDIVTSTVSAPVNTIAGQEDISLQLLEQSPIAMDGVVFQDLAADYARALDSQIIAGSGSNGQHLGVLSVAQNTSNTSITAANGVTVSSATFQASGTSGTQFSSIVNGKNQIETLRYAPATAIWVHPRRANSWEYAAVDTQQRPLFVPYAPFNAMGIDNPNVFQGVAGALTGLPVVKDANMPTTMNGTALTGGTADPIVVLKEDDLMLFEGTMRLRALPEILSGTLQIRYQAYCYSAFLPSRFLPSISILTGNTGLAAPSF